MWSSLSGGILMLSTISEHGRPCHPCPQDTGDYLPQLGVLVPAFCAIAKGQLPQGGATGIQAGGSVDACATESFRALDAYDSLVTRLSLENQVNIMFDILYERTSNC
jgi:hypothetical protein